jgi:hypothetical protein
LYNPPRSVLPVREPPRETPKRLSFFGLPMKRTYIYVDGFNLYYRLLSKEPRLKWLDLKFLFREILDIDNEIVKIRFFTARISGRGDLDRPRRQQLYLSALSSLSEVSIHYGNFLLSKKFARVKHPPEFMPPLQVQLQQPWPDLVKIHKTEEKGSDVNLACYLLLDAFQAKFDVAAIVSNDSDLVEPLKIATKELGKTVGLITPVPSPNQKLKEYASFVRHITRSDLARSQFPLDIHLPDGRIISRPDVWR